MIIWREGKAGFVGGAKTFIRGVFNFQYATPVTTNPVITFTAVKPTRGYVAIKPTRAYDATKIVNIL